MQSLNLRIIHTHDTQAQWDKLEDFIPKLGEIIVYDADNFCTYERFKIGDGKTKLINLPFTTNAIVESMFNIQNNVIHADAGRITDYKENSNT